MKYLNQHIATAESLYHDFKSSTDEKVLHLFLKKYFNKNKKYGKRDRKSISDIVYSLVRRELFGFEMSTVEYFLMENEDKVDIQQILKQDSSFLSEIRSLQFTAGMDLEQYVSRFYQKNNVFFRAPEGATAEVIEEYDGVPYIHEHINLQNVLDGEPYYIQDISCQKIWQDIDWSKGSFWDCCAGSGGKSLMYREIHPDAEMYASDKRISILRNLEKRFQAMSYSTPRTFEANLENMDIEKPFNEVDYILIDAPCSGSATWHRNPEAALQFDFHSLKSIADMQYEISKNALQSISKSGQFIYSTCSIWEAENEAIVEKILSKGGYSITSQKLLNYYPQGGDALFRMVAEVSNRP